MGRVVTIKPKKNMKNGITKYLAHKFCAEFNSQFEGGPYEGRAYVNQRSISWEVIIPQCWGGWRVVNCQREILECLGRITVRR